MEGLFAALVNSVMNAQSAALKVFECNPEAEIWSPSKPVNPKVEGLDCGNLRAVADACGWLRESANRFSAA